MKRNPRPDGQAGPAPPTVPPPPTEGLSPALERNIRALHQRSADEERRATIEEKLAGAITRFSGSMLFVYLHLLVFGAWVAVNAGLITVLPKWDESFVILGTAASVEAIFLSTFVLISQNRMSAASDKRADLDVQISLLAEHEITKLAAMISDIAKAVGVAGSADREVEEIKQDVAPEAVLDRIEQHRREQ